MPGQLQLGPRTLFLPPSIIRSRQERQGGEVVGSESGPMGGAAPEIGLISDGNRFGGIYPISAKREETRTSRLHAIGIRRSGSRGPSRARHGAGRRAFRFRRSLHARTGGPSSLQAQTGDVSNSWRGALRPGLAGAGARRFERRFAQVFPEPADGPLAGVVDVAAASEAVGLTRVADQGRLDPDFA